MNFRKIGIVLVLFSLLSGVFINAQESGRTFESVRFDKGVLQVVVNDGTIVFTPYTHSGIEVEFVPLGELNPPSYALNMKEAVNDAIYANNKNTITLSTGLLNVEISKAPFRISYVYNTRELFSEEQGFFDSDSVKGFRFNLSTQEKLMGGGERVLGMDRRGNRLQLYNRASYGYETHAELMYYSMPLYISSKKYMVAFDNGASGFLDLGATEENILQFEAVGGRMSYLLVAADEWPELVVNFTELTGRQPMLPRWALGNIASRMGYHSQDEVEAVVDQYRADDFPLDGIVLDLYWFGKDLTGHMGNLEWDLDSFPQPEMMLKRNKEKGVKTILITEPFILTNSGKYEECLEKGLLGLNSDGEPYTYDFFFGNTTLLDIFKTETKSWFWDIYKRHTITGVEGWWGDLGEPEVHPDDLLHINGRADEVHNIYGHEWAKMVYEGFAKDFPKRRPVILMRSGFVGSQRYGLVPWTGDVNRTWGGLKPQVEISLQMGMQGMAYMHSDLGGFAGSYEDSELYTRWLQYGVFQPIYRTHAQEDVPPEPIFWDEATRNITRKFIKLRYELMPYTYSLTYCNAIKGIPMMRPLFYYDDSPELLDEKDSYMWGDNFLVSPVVEKGITEQKVYLPKGHVWFNYFSGERFDGGQTVSVKLDINTIPVFVKAGSFIPTVPLFNSMDEYSSEKLILHYYHDKSVKTAQDIMYEDDGETKEAYFNQEYELLKFESVNENSKLIITINSEGYDYKGKPENREVDLLIYHFETKPSVVLINGEKVKVATKMNKSSSTYYDKSQNTIRIKLSNVKSEVKVEIQ